MLGFSSACFCAIYFNLFSDYFRAMLLKPSYETPYDTTEQILKSGIIPINSNGTVLVWQIVKVRLRYSRWFLG